MVSAGYANAHPNVHHYAGQSQTQYLKEVYGISSTMPPAQNVLPNESEWPSLNNALMCNEHDRSQRNIGRRAMNPMSISQQMNRRPASINPQLNYFKQPDAARNLNAVQQMNAQIQKAQMQSNGPTPKNPKLYKTELCRSWADTGKCNYNDRCQFAHGVDEKRPVPRHPKYKTEMCQSYHQTGYCGYGARCHFIHNEEAHVLAQMVAANTVATKQQQQPSPTRPNNLFTSNNAAAAVGGTCSSPTTTGPWSLRDGKKRSTTNQNPNYLNHQFQTQLQIFNDVLKTPMHNGGNSTPSQATGLGEMGGSTGDSPIPSSNDSGTESPICSFSPGSELDDPAFFFVRKQMEASQGKKSQTPTAPLNLLPSSLNSDFSSSSSTSSNVGTKSLNSPIIGSPPQIYSTPTIWSNGAVGTPTTSAARLPVFERLSNGP